MKRYDIRAVLEATDLVALISEYTELKRHGRQYRGRCPFHAEKTPSFYVNPDKQAWYCWGACHTGGNAIAFLERNGKKFGEALRYLAERAGVPAVDEPARAPMPSQRMDAKQLAVECEAFWREVRFLLVRHRNAILADLRRLRASVEKPAVRTRRAWLLAGQIGLIGESAVRDLEYCIDLIGRARPRDLMSVYRQQPEHIQRWAREEARQWNQLTDALMSACG